MRKSFEGLSAIVEELFPNELFSGSFFLFLNKRRTHLKVLFWDKDGFIIWYKRLEKGTFSSCERSNTLIDRKIFFMLLEGIQPKHIKARFHR